MATQEVLKDMLKSLKTAMDRNPSDQVFTRLEQIYNDTYRLYTASHKRIEFLDKSIAEKENSNNKQAWPQVPTIAPADCKGSSFRYCDPGCIQQC
ncbi:MAG: hypothetical protein K8F91_14205 [Candidatus Obscuribacterales bacterium]|nr:hypothetical protein [Candidatus Obscuribacterales bacterium]